jgi:hypothetical protein
MNIDCYLKFHADAIGNEFIREENGEWLYWNYDHYEKIKYFDHDDLENNMTIDDLVSQLEQAFIDFHKDQLNNIIKESFPQEDVFPKGIRGSGNMADPNRDFIILDDPQEKKASQSVESQSVK